MKRDQFPSLLLRTDSRKNVAWREQGLAKFPARTLFTVKKNSFGTIVPRPLSSQALREVVLKLRVDHKKVGSPKTLPFRGAFIISFYSACKNISIEIENPR